MAHRIHISPAWCEEHLAQCYHSFDEQTQVSKHLGDPESISPAISPGAEISRLEKQGYYISHNGGGAYTATRYNDRLQMPLDWQMAIEERESIDEYQDW